MVLFRRVFDWLMVRDYDVAKKRSAVETAARYSRGNISVQNGWFIDAAKLKELSIAADHTLQRLKQKASHI